MNSNRQGMVVSRVNLTIDSIESSEGIPPPENPRDAGDLVYNYNNAFEESKLHTRRQEYMKSHISIITY